MVTNSKEISKLQSEMSVLKKANERLNDQLCKLNLIYHGVPDSEHESPEELYDQLNNIVFVKNPIDTAWRMGKFTKSKIRPIKVRLVKVRFLSLHSREEEYKNCKNLNPPFHINADLPKSTREAHSVLRKMKHEAIIGGKRATVNWKNQTIQSTT